MLRRPSALGTSRLPDGNEQAEWTPSLRLSEAPKWKRLSAKQVAPPSSVSILAFCGSEDETLLPTLWHNQAIG